MRLAAALAALALLMTPAHARTYSDRLGDGFYRSTDDAMVHRPTRMEDPAFGKATANCRDGTVSYSHHHRETCSGHGGVAAFR